VDVFGVTWYVVRLHIFPFQSIYVSDTMKMINSTINTMAIIMLLFSFILMLQNTAWNVAIIEGILGVIFLVWNLDIKQR
jgi:hypothetical protein